MPAPPPPNDSASGGYLAPTLAPVAEDDALDAILQGLVAGVTGLSGTLVRPRWQLIPSPDPEPTVDWCTVGVVDEQTSTFGSDRHVSGDGSLGNPIGFNVTKEQVELTILVSFYGPHARGNGQLLRSGLGVSQNRDALYGTGISLVRLPGPGVFIPEIVNNRTYRRYDLRFVLRRNVQTSWPVDDLVYADIVVETDRPSREEIITPSSLDPLTP